MNPDFIRQYEALTTRCGSALLERTLLQVLGSDRVSFLHAFSTGDVKKLALHEGCEAFITSAQGKTLGHGFIFRDDDCLWLDTAASQAESLIAHFDRYVISEDVQFVDQSATWCDLLVAGPESPRVLNGDLPALRSFTWRDLAGKPVAICRTDFTGEPSYFLRTSREHVPELMASLPEAVACEVEAIEAARIEARVPLFGLDITADNLPQEVGRDAEAISFHKGCYLGQETVARIDALGHVNKLLVGVAFSGDSVPARGTELLRDGAAVGAVTSAAWSPRLQAPLALAYVRRPASKPGTQLESAAGRAAVR